MRYRKEIRAEDVCPGDYLEDEDKFVIGVNYTSSSVILRCAYEMRSYPCTSLIFEPDQMVAILMLRVLMAERARLRNALQSIDEMRAVLGETQEELAYEMRSIAKAALKDTGHE